MPRMNGYETITWVKTHFPEIKILVLTVFNTEAARQIALHYGADDFATKDIELTAMEKVLYSLMATKGNPQKSKAFLSKKELEFFNYSVLIYPLQILLKDCTCL